MNLTYMHAKSLQSCLTLCDPMDCSLLDSSAHGILQARLLEWVAMPSSTESSQPRDQTSISSVSWIGRVFFTTEPPEKPGMNLRVYLIWTSSSETWHYLHFGSDLFCYWEWGWGVYPTHCRFLATFLICTHRISVALPSPKLW